MVVVVGTARLPEVAIMSLKPLRANLCRILWRVMSKIGAIYASAGIVLGFELSCTEGLHNCWRMNNSSNGGYPCIRYPLPWAYHIPVVGMREHFPVLKDAGVLTHLDLPVFKDGNLVSYNLFC